jgi:hypothetical protein
VKGTFEKMKRSIVLALLMGASFMFAGNVGLANCGKGVTIRNDNASDITITQISYRPTGNANYTVWPNKQGAPGVPYLLAAGASWTPVLGVNPNPCNTTIEVKVDYTLGGVAYYEVDEITDIQRLVTVQLN